MQNNKEINNTTTPPSANDVKSGTNSKQQAKTFEHIDGNTLLAMDIPPLLYIVEKILPVGIYTKAGSPKIGKSWLTLGMAMAVATGGEIWGLKTTHSDVLYLALEDNRDRIHRRLEKLGGKEKDVSKMHFVTTSKGIYSGLLEQIHNFMLDYPNTRMIVIDTLVNIRDSVYNKNMYTYDYRDIAKLREITDKYAVSLVLVHHTRKMYDPDPLNTLSGSTGLTGSLDGVFVLEKDKRIAKMAKLTISNRDTEDFCFKIRFSKDDCKWEFVEDISDIEEDDDDPLCFMVNDFVDDKWEGTASKLCNELREINNEHGFDAATLSKRLSSQNIQDRLKKDYGISVTKHRTHAEKIITLTRNDKPD